MDFFCAGKEFFAKNVNLRMVFLFALEICVFSVLTLCLVRINRNLSKTLYA